MSGKSKGECLAIARTRAIELDALADRNKILAADRPGRGGPYLLRRVLFDPAAQKEDPSETNYDPPEVAGCLIGGWSEALSGLQA
jgi:hypothetical protein